MAEATERTEVAELRGKVADLRKDLGEVARLAKDKVVTGTTEWTKEHPMAALAIAAGLGASIGLAVGLLIGRNRG
ncbi:MAG TPA: hypothetical protein VNE39_23760 [Planctomycetota bacterium]|nr:hypothetical protein [Planctomycetota bacterium]